MSRLMKDIAYILSLILIMVHILPIIWMLSVPVVRNTIFKGTYVEWIIAPKKGDKIKKALDKFNKIGYNNSVKYSGYRPIYIFEGSLPEGTLGQAAPTIGFCTIEISDIPMSDKMIEEVVMHEYIHCFGYPHNPGICTLMYWNYEPWCPSYLMELSKQYYSKEIAEKFYE